MINKIKELIKNELFDCPIVSFRKFVEVAVVKRRTIIKEYDGFAIWGAFSIRDNLICLYTQDSKANIKFYDPEKETLRDNAKN